jgi:hypothetical protein
MSDPCSISSAPSASSSDADVRFVVAGDGYAVTCDDEATRDGLARWTTLLSGETAEPTRFALRTRGPGAPAIEREGVLSCTLESSEDLLPAFEGMLYARMSRRLPRLHVLHAATLARHGKAVVFLGPSGAGKSVLSLSLCERGWTYLSDEFAPIDERMRVVAVPRPVSFDPEEIAPELLARITRGRVTWSTQYRARSGGHRSAVHVLPERAAPSGASFQIAAFFRLDPRPGAAPVLRRMPPVEMRAFLFAVLSGAPRP